MKTNNFNSQARRSIYANPGFVKYFLAASAILLFSSVHLILSDPTSYWYLPLAGVLLFIFFLTLIQGWKIRLLKKTSQSDEFEELDYIRPVMITKFGKQNSANNKLFVTTS